METGKKYIDPKREKKIKWLWIILLSPFALLILLLLFTGLGLFGRLPSFEELENPKSNISTEIFSEDGKVIGSFFVQNRSYMSYDELFSSDTTINTSIRGKEYPPIVAALISTEDARFESHSGIDFPSLVRVGVKTVAMQRSSQGGGSTLTQQLAKNLFPRDTTSNRSGISRKARLVISKLKEWITAVKLERNYTKNEIAAMYLNTVAYGSNAYGIKSAAHTFFGKSPNELNMQECALLVGVVNAPTRYSPVRNEANALERRNVVLKRMEQSGAITERQYDSLSVLPIILNYKPISHNDGTATYFRDMLRQVMNAEPPRHRDFYNEWDYKYAKKQYDENPIYGWCKKNSKEDGSSYDIYRDGLKIYTTIDSRMQEYAEAALLKQLRNVIQPKLDAQVRATKVLFQGVTPQQREQLIQRAMRTSDRYREMRNSGFSDEQIAQSFNRRTQMRIFTYRGERDTVMTPRDSILHHKQIMRAGFVAIAPQNGHVKAYVGGPNFRYFKYDMANQGKRQVGSTIKPFVYTFAIDQLGMSPFTMVPNLPVSIDTGVSVWSPKEAGAVKYDGALHPLSWGLAHSRNNYSAWIMKEAKQPEAVAEFIHNMGIHSYIDPVYALCLGSSEATVMELVSAFTTFPNRGVHIDPIFVTRIEDRHGNVIASFTPQSNDAISEGTAYTMLGMLQKVVKSGTGGKLGWQFGMSDVEIGGKTGTSQRNRDAWFVAVAPNLVAGAWVGGEDQSVHPTSGGEGSVMALPIVGDFLTRIYSNGSLGVNRTDKFSVPAILPSYDFSTEDTYVDDAPTEDEFFD